MAQYVDGFVLPVPRKKIDAYRRMSAKAGKMWMKYGALEYRECVGDDLKTTWGKSFPSLAKTKSGETVVFSWILYKSKAHRDSVNKKLMKDPYMTNMDMSGMPFDVKRMAYGGFKTIVKL